MHRFWVVGGLYRDTRLREFAAGRREERYGPFRDRAAARTAWGRLSWAQVDDCHVRYRIVEDAGAIAC
jgi:hypothetical protein